MIRRKEEELLAMIAQQKEELANLQMERDKEEKRVGFLKFKTFMDVLTSFIVFTFHVIHYLRR